MRFPWESLSEDHPLLGIAWRERGLILVPASSVAGKGRA
jgi:hypothetical protein